MRRVLSIIVLLSILLLSGCRWFQRHESETGFLDSTYLAECRLSGIPIPVTEDLRHDENTVYCNLTDAERESYISELATYLLEKDDIYYKGYYFELGNPGGIFYLPEYRFAPLTEDVDCSNGWFAFSLTEQLNGDDEYNDSYWNGISVKIEPKEGEIGSFRYNTVIVIDNDPNGIVYQSEIS